MSLLGYFGPGGGNPALLNEALLKLGWQKPGYVSGPGFGAVLNGPGYCYPAESGSGLLAGRVICGGPLLERLEQAGPEALRSDQADGAYALAWQDSRNGTLLLAADPFGSERLYYTRQAGTLWFSTRWTALLALPFFQRKRELNLEALHTYLTFSFAAAPYTLLNNISIIEPNAALIFSGPESTPRSFRLMEPPAPLEEPEGKAGEGYWMARLEVEIKGAIARRLAGAGEEVAVHLSGGLDSSAIAAWLAQMGQRVRLYHLDFGPPFNAELPYARQVAAHLGLGLECIPVAPRSKDIGLLLRRVVWRMGEAWGDPVTLPLLRGYEAVRQAGFEAVFNGEGGDQLFAGWPNRAMLAAELYSGLDGGQEQRVHNYLQTFHHFYGLEAALYGPALRQAAGRVPLASLAEPYLNEKAFGGLFERLRWTNYWLKGSQNIMPRAAGLARQSGVRMEAPFFDRRLARLALEIPPGLLWQGATEKYLLKQTLAARNLLPAAVLERPKRGMGVPAGEWCLAGGRDEFRRLLARLEKRGLFRKDYLRMLMQGRDLESEIRQRRRAGEKIWQLAILEIWLELFYDKATLKEP